MAMYDELFPSSLYSGIKYLPIFSFFMKAFIGGSTGNMKGIILSLDEILRSLKDNIEISNDNNDTRAAKNAAVCVLNKSIKTVITSIIILYHNSKVSENYLNAF